MEFINNLHFRQDNLIPTIVIDHYSKQVLTLAYMNSESLQISIQEGRTCFFSRKRQCLWRKGETSGNIQWIESIYTDCDQDALLIEVKKTGPACHKGTDSCFTAPIWRRFEQAPFSIHSLYEMIQGRKASPKDGSYTSYLFKKGLDKILKKVGEETTEVVIGAKGGSKEETIFEIADLVYHLLVLMTECDITPKDVFKELEKRQIIDHKVKQETMQ